MDRFLPQLRGGTVLDYGQRRRGPRARGDGPKPRSARTSIPGPRNGSRRRASSPSHRARVEGRADRGAGAALGQCHHAHLGEGSVLAIVAAAPGAPASVMVFNDMSHLPERLRWTEFPDSLRS
jgi:hypothetical protein